MSIPDTHWSELPEAWEFLNSEEPHGDALTVETLTVMCLEVFDEAGLPGCIADQLASAIAARLWVYGTEPFVAHCGCDESVDGEE